MTEDRINELVPDVKCVGRSGSGMGLYYHNKVKKQTEDLRKAVDIIKSLLEDAEYLYQYYPNNYRKKAEGYFNEAYSFIKEITESRE